jgi:hypothetical protein
LVPSGIYLLRYTLVLTGLKSTLRTMAVWRWSTSVIYYSLSGCWCTNLKTRYSIFSDPLTISTHSRTMSGLQTENPSMRVLVTNRDLIKQFYCFSHPCNKNGVNHVRPQTGNTRHHSCLKHYFNGWFRITMQLAMTVT